MYARLWWKDVRQFWPIWVFLALAAAVVQGLLLHYLGSDARQGLLGLSALLCASLYAFAAGAAAFAGEREAGTLRLLDILPVDRRVVWAAKVSFALVTTLALTLVLLAMAAMSTDRWIPPGFLSFWVALSFGMIVLVALGWGLFWSAILSNALAAAVTAICCTALSLNFLGGFVEELYYGGGLVALWQLFVILATMIASDVIFARAMRWRRVQFEFRSPVVVTRAESASPRRVQIQIQSPVATVLPRRAAAGMPESLVTDQSPRRSWVVEAQALAWQTMKEGGRTWCLLAAIGLVLPTLIFLISGYLDYPWVVILSIGVALVAGASVFGLENRMRTHRFLTHHGARPGLVWLAKLAVWGLGLAVIWGPLPLMAKISMVHSSVRGIENWLLSVLIIPLFFGVAQLCGMVIRRGITAVVVALMIGLALVIPLVSLAVAQMLPVQGLLVIPAGLLAVSWAWSGDWLLNRPVPGRWLRLGLLMTGTFALLLGWYAGFRAWSLPDVGPIAAPQTWIDAAATPLPAEQNAADLYREAGRRLVGPDTADSPEFLNRNREALDLVRRAAARPDCRFHQPDKLTLVDPPDLPPIGRLALLVTLDLQDRQKHGDLAGDWDGIVVLFRMARHFGKGAALYPAFSLVSMERDALSLAMEWAIARGQTPERLQAALTAYRDLPKIPPAADVVRAEANLVEKTLDLPTSKFRDWLYESMNGPPQSERVLTSALVDVVTTPWERARARRVNRLVSAAAIQSAMREPWQRSGHASRGLDNVDIRYAQTTTPLAMMHIPPTGSYLYADDYNEVARRALVQIIALCAWQLRHGGQFPDRLDALVPEELPSLPTDPYSGRPFGYVRSDGHVVPPPRFALGTVPGELQAPAKGSWLLYSVGPDGHDDGGITFKDNDHRSQPMDIVFAIPPVEGDSGAGKGKGQDGAEDRPAPPASRPSPPGSGR